MSLLKSLVLRLRFHACAAAALLLAAQCMASTVQTANGSLSIDLPQGWNASAKDDDPDAMLYVKKGRTELLVKSLNQSIRDKYLKMRLSDDITELRGRGYTLSGGIDSYSIHNAATFYFTGYDIGEQSVRTGYFTYGGNTYAVLATNVDMRDLENTLYSVRKAGEPAPVRPKPKPSRRKAEKELPPENLEPLPAPPDEPVPAAYQAAAFSGVDISTSLAQGATASAVAEHAGSAAPVAAAPLARPAPVAVLPPYIVRHALPVWLWGALAALWLLLTHGTAVYAQKLSYPKIEPLPKDIPPDFFFPFLITGFNMPLEVQYTVTSRSGQKIVGRFEREGETILPLGLYGLAITHILWSIIASAGFEGPLLHRLLQIPGGRLLASVPELPFLIIIFYGLAKRTLWKNRLALVDREDKPLLEAVPDNGGVSFRDPKGKKVAMLKRMKGRNWQYCDAESKPVFEVRDDHPELLFKRRLCGWMNGRLRARYSLFAGGKRVGFILNDPSSNARMQIHLEFEHGRMAQSTHIVLAALYAKTIDRDFAYPWFR